MGAPNYQELFNQYLAVKNDNYNTSASNETYKPKEIPANRLSSVNPREITFKSSFAETETRISKFFKALPFVGTGLWIGDEFSNWGTQWYIDKITALEKQGYNILKEGDPLKTMIHKTQQEKAERKPITDPAALPNHGSQKAIPEYKKQEVAPTDTLLSILRDSQGLQNHDFSQVAAELVAQSELMRLLVSVQAHQAQIMDANSIIASEQYGVMREQYNALSSIHKVLDNSMVAHVEMMGQLTDVIRDLVSATHANMLATNGVAAMTARTPDEMKETFLSATKLEFETQPSSFTDLEGEITINGSPMEIKARKDASELQQRSDTNNYKLEGEEDVYNFDAIDIIEHFGLVKPSAHYASLYNTVSDI